MSLFLYLQPSHPHQQGTRRRCDLPVSPQPLHAGARQTRVVLYLLFLFCVFLSGELIQRGFFLAMRQYSRMSSALLNLILVVVLLFCFYFIIFIIVEIWFHVVSSRLWAILWWGQFPLGFSIGGGIRMRYFKCCLTCGITCCGNFTCFTSDTLLRLLVNYYLFATSFLACGCVIVLGIFRFW